jgi:trehalose synthase
MPSLTKLSKVRRVEDYAKFVGGSTIDRLKKKAKALEGLHITNVNSTYYGGGVAEILSSMTILMNSLKLKTGWRTITGRPDFFSITKKMHNGLQGGPFDLTPRKKKIYEEVTYENSIRNHLDHDYVIVHDPQPLPLIRHYRKKGPWIWRCHIDLTKPNQRLWNYLKPFVERYDSAIVSIKEYQQKIKIPQFLFMPAIDPFSVKNAPLSETEMSGRLKHYKIPTDLPLVVQVSRFDRWKDPEGVIAAFKKARQKVDCTLVLLGNAATDDPEGEKVFESILKCREERILILPYGDDTALVNALQTKAACVLQKSTREGFGLTVTEAMWKGTPVIGGNVGGIRYQIKNGFNGYLVSDVDEAATAITKLVKDRQLRQEMGKNAQKSVRDNFLLTRLLEQYLDLFLSFDTKFSLKSTARN